MGQCVLPKRMFELCLSSLQFHRSFPGPADVTPAEVDMLGHRYFDPTTGLYNYLQFHNDILTIGAGETGATLELTPQLPSIPVSSREMSVITHSHVSFPSTIHRRLVCVTLMRYFGGSGMPFTRTEFVLQSFSEITTSSGAESSLKTRSLNTHRHTHTHSRHRHYYTKGYHSVVFKCAVHLSYHLVFVVCAT